MGDLSVGSWDKLPHYSVVGVPTSFYVWINLDNQTFHDPEQGASAWVKGRVAFDAYAKLRRLYGKGKVKGFIEVVKELHKSNRKGVE